MVAASANSELMVKSIVWDELWEWELKEPISLTKLVPTAAGAAGSWCSAAPVVGEGSIAGGESTAQGDAATNVAAELKDIVELEVTLFGIFQVGSQQTASGFQVVSFRASQMW